MLLKNIGGDVLKLRQIFHYFEALVSLCSLRSSYGENGSKAESWRQVSLFATSNFLALISDKLSSTCRRWSAILH